MSTLLGQAGRSAGDIEAFVTELAGDHRTAALPVVDRAMVDYAVKLTRSPWAMTAGDVEALRQHGLDDRGIHDLCAIVAYFNFVNRMADGLGVELERT